MYFCENFLSILKCRTRTTDQYEEYSVELNLQQLTRYLYSLLGDGHVYFTIYIYAKKILQSNNFNMTVVISNIVVLGNCSYLPLISLSDVKGFQNAGKGKIGRASILYFYKSHKFIMNGAKS